MTPILFRPPKAADYLGLAVSTLAKQRLRATVRNSFACRPARLAISSPISTSGSRRSAAARRQSTAPPRPVPP